MTHTARQFEMTSIGTGTAAETLVKAKTCLEALAERQNRRAFEPFYQTLKEDQRMRIVPAEPSLWERGLTLYFQRPDKEWSLTDCISFVVMQEEGLTEALTGDHHFGQAGFKALLRENDL